jgi:deazaflavin-dependent oxidoreductase (nitroreductase family)
MSPLDAATLARLARTRTIDLTTFGRRSGLPVRVEIWWFHIDGRFVVTGTPGPRHWYANVRADPRVVVHTRHGDHPGTAIPITDPAFRRRVFTDRATRWYATQVPLEALVATSPMIEIAFG